MRSAQVLVRLYPAPVRERWGADLEQQLAESGPRSWPDAIRGAAGLWIRPALWPQTSAGRNRRTLSTLAIAVIVLTTLLLRATGGRALTAGPPDPFRSIWLVLVLLGLLAAAPTPALRVATLARVARVSIRTLGPPVLALLVMLITANSGLISHPTGLANALLVAYYWATLTFGGARVCALTARLANITNAPSVRRLRVALTLIGSGLALAVYQLTAAMARTQADVADLVATATLVAFVVVIAAAARDLRTMPG